MYANGESERIIAKAIKKYNLPREKLVILTKCYGFVGEEPNIRGVLRVNELRASKDYVNQGGLSRAAIFNAVKKSLERLETDYIDVLQIHHFDDATPIEETMEALHDLVKSGKVRKTLPKGLKGCMAEYQTGPVPWSKLHVGVSVCHDASLRRETRLDKVHLHAGEKRCSPVTLLPSKDDCRIITTCCTGKRSAK